ncbi:electron transport complex subunit RsxG [Kaarinaea lacus]
MYGKGVEKPSFQKRTAYHAMLLGGIAMTTSALIVIGNKQTRADIELRKIEDMKNSLAQVIHPDIHTNDLLHDVLQLKVKGENKSIYIAKSNDNVVGVAFESSVQGYAGPINVIVGINRKGELLGTRILSHSETPGLGDKIEAEKHPWVYSFDGLSLSNPTEEQWKVKKDGGYFDSFTGATITPRAVIKAVKSSLEIFEANKNILLAETKKDTDTNNQPLKQTTPSNEAQDIKTPSEQSIELNKHKEPNAIKPQMSTKDSKTIKGVSNG